MQPRWIGFALLLPAVAVAAPAPKTVPLPKPRPAVPAPASPAMQMLQVPAKQLFGQQTQPDPAAPRSIGFYAHGCLAGAMALPIDGRTWQVMRLSRNRNWGHPNLIRFLERFSAKLPQAAGWPGILVGDLSQPRGGPMLTGHASHQVGLDADIWLTPMPPRTLTRAERETMAPLMMIRADKKDIDRQNWTPSHLAVIRAAARDPAVERIFVNAAIKKALCREAGGDRGWLHKVRPYWGHTHHMHIRLHCPANSPQCEKQPPPGPDDGCGKELDWWFRDAILHPKPPAVPPKPKPPLMMKDLPAACRLVLTAP